jgi:hypothetical protein
MHRTIVLVGGDALLEKAHRDIGGNIIVAIEHDNLEGGGNFIKYIKFYIFLII